MSALPITRTQYFNVATGTVRAGSSTHGESLTDVESGLLPLARATESSLHSWGIADGLTVGATTGQPGVRVAPGTALDARGRLISLAAGGVAVTDPAADPTQVVNIATVSVNAAGVLLGTAGLGPATLLLTVTFREVQDQGQIGAPPVLLHAPWLRLRAEAAVADDGVEVVLARVGLDAADALTSLEPTRRRAAGLPAGRIELRRPVAAAGAGPSVSQQAGALLAVPDEGGLELTGTPEGVAGQQVRLLSIDAALTRAQLLPAGGRLSLGVAGPAETALHVEGDQGIHSGGPGGGLSFADRGVGSFVASPNAGQRYVWYATSGQARLWSGRDLLTVAPTGEGLGLDVARRMRVRQGGDGSAGVWFFQDAPRGDRAFVGMASDNEVGFYGIGAGWALRMDVTNGSLRFGGDFGRPDGAATMSLWGSRIGDIGNGTLFIRSGGAVVAFDGGDSVGIGTASPGGQLGVVSTGVAITANNTQDGPFRSAVQATGAIGVLANGRGTGIWATGNNFGVVGGAVAGGTAGQFYGNVSITGTLSKGGGGFKIDHPLDPQNSYLSHSFVESPEMLNVYRGTVTTDASGEAVVRVPEYVETLNKEFTYHLTVIGEPATAAVAEPLRDSAFRIRCDRPRTRVCWILLGERADPWADAHRIQVEEPKEEHVRGRLLHPEVRDGAAQAYAHPDHEELAQRSLS